MLRIGRSGGWRYSARLVALAPDWEPEKISPHSWITIGGKIGTWEKIGNPRKYLHILGLQLGGKGAKRYRGRSASPFTIIGNQNANKLLQAHTLCVECNLNLLE